MFQTFIKLTRLSASYVSDFYKVSSGWIILTNDLFNVYYLYNNLSAAQKDEDPWSETSHAPPGFRKGPGHAGVISRVGRGEGKWWYTTPPPPQKKGHYSLLVSVLGSDKPPPKKKKKRGGSSLTMWQANKTLVLKGRVFSPCPHPQLLTPQLPENNLSFSPHKSLKIGNSQSGIKNID